MRALERAHKSGKGFRIAYIGDPSPAAFEIWSHGLWEILDGGRETFAIIEEYGDCCGSPGSLSTKREFFHRRLWTQGRKYGAIIHATSQKPQLITKDALDNAAIIWASHMGLLPAERVAKEIEISSKELRDCSIGEFFFRDNVTQAEKMRVFTPL